MHCRQIKPNLTNQISYLLCVSRCPPSVRHQRGPVTWHANCWSFFERSSWYPSQEIECLWRHAGSDREEVSGRQDNQLLTVSKTDHNAKLRISVLTSSASGWSRCLDLCGAGTGLISLQSQQICGRCGTKQRSNHPIYFIGIWRHRWMSHEGKHISL